MTSRTQDAINTIKAPKFSNQHGYKSTNGNCRVQTCCTTIMDKSIVRLFSHHFLGQWNSLDILQSWPPYLFGKTMQYIDNTVEPPRKLEKLFQSTQLTMFTSYKISKLLLSSHNFISPASVFQNLFHMKILRKIVPLNTFRIFRPISS